MRGSKNPPSAGEGWTPLRQMKSLGRNVFAKDETRNPTGTFKDRGASAAITRLSELRVRRVVLASEGNAACSFALYSQMAGIQCHAFVPKQADEAKVRLIKKLGAKISRVTGTLADAGVRAARVATSTHQYNCSTFVTPFRHDGKGTMALEISEQSNWQPPDWLVYPVGGGVGLVGMWKMFQILERIGWTKKKPRIVAVQPSGCAPVVQAYNLKKSEVQEWKSPKTIANGLRIPKPLGGKWILKCLRESKGIAVKVSESEIRNAMHHLAAKEGMLVEPSSATAFAAIPRLYDSGSIDQGDKLVVIATGSGLKTLEQF